MRENENFDGIEDFEDFESDEGANFQPISPEEIELARQSLRDITGTGPSYAEQTARVEDLEATEALRAEAGIPDPERIEFTPDEEGHLDGMTAEAMNVEDGSGVENGSDATSESAEEAGVENIEKDTESFARRVLDFLLSGDLREKFKADPKISGWFEKFDEFRPELEGFISKGAGAIAEQSPEKVKQIYGLLKERLPAEVQSAVENELKSGSNINWEKVKNLLYGSMDFVPFLGGVKMSAEAIAGKTLAGKELEGWRRAMHAVEGVAFTALDFTGVGGVATRGAKGSALTIRALRRSAAVTRKLGAARGVYAPIWKTATLIQKNPMLLKAIDKSFSMYRKRRAEDMVVNNREKDTPNKIDDEYLAEAA